MSESQSLTYGIETPIASTRSLQSNQQPIDYLSFNDGFEEDTPSSPKRRKKTTYHPRNAPSTTRVAAQKTHNSPEAKETDNRQTLSGVPPVAAGNLSGVLELLGVPPVTSLKAAIAGTLPDLVVNHDTETNEEEAVNTVSDNPGNIENDLEAADILLNLSDARNNTLDDADNSQLMAVGIPSNVVDAAPVPLRLDKVNMDSAIADLVQAEELENPDKDKTITNQHITENVDAPGSTGEKDDKNTTEEE